MPKPPPDRGELIFSPDGGPLKRPKAGARKGGKQGAGKGRGKLGKERPAVPQDGVVRVSRERRQGKGVTLISGVPLHGAELAALGKALKQHCGSGGTTKDGVIEVQGDQRDVIVADLQARGFTVKRVGG